MAACYGCKCNTCAQNMNIGTGWFTPGEVDECCFNCDDCMVTNGIGRFDPEKGCYSGRWKGDCPDYLEPQKYTEFKSQSARRSFRVIGSACQKKKEG